MITEPTPHKKAIAAVRLDELALARLREIDPDGRHRVVTRVLAAFETSLARMLTQLQAERTNEHTNEHADGQTAVVASVAHTLKSSSASVGALELALACAEIEQKLRCGDASALQSDISRLIAEAESALLAVAAILRP